MKQNLIKDSESGGKLGKASVTKKLELSSKQINVENSNLTEKEKVFSPAVSKANKVLELLASTPQKRFSLAEIARILGLPKSSMFNVCSELVKAKLLRRSEDGYLLGSRLVQLGSSYVESVDMIREFYEACRNTPSSLNALIQLAVLDEELNAIFLARQDCSSGLRLGLRSEIGRKVPANCTAAGKAMLSTLSNFEIERRLQGIKSLPRFTDASVSSPSQLREQLKTIREKGYAAETGEIISNIECVAKPIITSLREDPLLAISVTADRASMNAERREKIKEELFRLADNLESRL